MPTKNTHAFTPRLWRRLQLPAAPRWLAHAALVLSALCGVSLAGAQTTSVLIDPGDQGGSSPALAFVRWKAAVEEAVRTLRLPQARIKFSTDATEDLGTTRSQIHDLYVAPAHVIGSAIRYGYTPVVGISQTQPAVLVALRSHPAGDLAAAKGARLGLPMQDSLVTYLLRGELNAANTTVKQHFVQLYETRYQEALLVCLKMQRCDVVAVEQALFDAWQRAGEPVKAVMRSKEAPGLSVAIRQSAGVDPRRLRSALEKAWAGQGAQGGPGLQALQSADFTYVSTLGYFTPTQLAGVTRVDAAEVAKLLAAGAVYVDARTQAEFEAGHVPGARFVPYHEVSAKAADFDAAMDRFELSALPADRAAPLVIGCNGPECWKSFKASTAARQAGYTRLYWFREGFPGWRSAGHPVATGP